MAITVRYFSDSDGPDGNDGTTWARRATAISGGTWNSIITAHDFATNGSLIAYIEGAKTYSPSGAATFSVSSPSVANPLIIHGCDSSGNPLEPADPTWTCDQPEFDDSAHPILSMSSNAAFFTSTTGYRCVRLVGTANTTNSLIHSSSAFIDWCTASISGAGHSTLNGLSSNYVTNTSLVITSTAFAGGISGVNVNNVRIEGPGSGASGSGNRHGWRSTSSVNNGTRVCVFGFPGDGISMESSSTGFQILAKDFVVDDVGGDGVALPSTASISLPSRIVGGYISNCGAYGIDMGAVRVLPAGNRVRDCTSGAFNNTTNYPSTWNNTDSGDDTEFADYAGGDFRIANDGAVWGMGYGVSDEPAAGGAGGALVIGG